MYLILALVLAVVLAIILATDFALRTDFIALRNELFIKRANNLTNILCHKLSKERDTLLLERGSPNIGGKS